MNSRKQMGTKWQLKSTHFRVSRLSDKQTQRKFLKNRAAYACLGL